MTAVRIFSVCGKRYRIRYVAKDKRRPNLGSCDNPNRIHKEIVIERGQTSEGELDTLLHELLHAGSWILSEDHVDRWARDVARVLTRLGYSRKES